MPGGNKSDSAGGRTQKFVVRNIAGDKRFTAERERIGAKMAARAAAQAARTLGDERTADYTDGVADDLVALADSAGHVIRR